MISAVFGAHLSVAGGLENAVQDAARLRMDCVQVFTSNQRQWKSRRPSEEQVAVWLAALRERGWHHLRGPMRVVSHASYLINLASPDRSMWHRSIDAMRSEIERCETLRIRGCVMHPGAHLGDAPPRGVPLGLGRPPSRDERRGLNRIAKAIDRIHRDLPGYRTRICLETTAGTGSNLGYDFGHLAIIRDAVVEPERVGFCLDTCHVTAAGYDMTTARSAAAVMRTWGATCGFRDLRVIHVNDSIGAVGSRIDRHAHIGAGECGRACFGEIVNRRSLAAVPKILETPKGTNDRGQDWDQVNTRRLKRLIRPGGSSRYV